MEVYIDSPIYLLFKLFFLSLLCVSAFGTVVIPTFFNDKMVKPHNNYTSNLSFRNRLSLLTKYAILFICCVLTSGVSGYVLAKMDGIESSIEQKKHFAEILDIKHKGWQERDSLTSASRDSIMFLRDSLNKAVYNKQVKSVQDTVATVKSLLTAKSFQYDNLSLKLEAEHKENVKLQSELNSPFITIQYDSLTPSLEYDYNKKVYAFNFVIVNIGKGRADSVTFRYTFVSCKNNVARLVDDRLSSTTRSMESLNEGVGYSRTVWLDDSIVYANLFPVYLAIQIEYKNQFHEQRPPSRRIYPIDFRYIKKPLPKLSDHDYKIIESFLFNSVYKMGH